MGFLGTQYAVELGQIFILGFGWILATFYIGWSIIVKFFTPASAFLKAKFTKGKGLTFLELTGDATGTVKHGKKIDEGLAEIPGVGPVKLTPRSHILEQKSKTPFYIWFAEQGITIPPEFPAILQELKESGYKLANFDDYDKLIKLATNHKFQDEQLGKIEDEQLKKEFRKNINELAKQEISLKYYKTYNMHDLASMFPLNLSPSYIQTIMAKVEYKALKNKLMKPQFVLVIAVAAMIILVGAGIAIKLIGNAAPAKCMCEAAAPVVHTVMQNLTI